MKIVRTYKGLETKRGLSCHGRFCTKMARGGGRWCDVHRHNLTRYGHYDATPIRRSQYRTHIKGAREYLLATNRTEATTLALEALDRALSPAFIPTSPRYYKVHEALVRLREQTKSSGGRRYHAPITIEMLLAEAMALHVYYTRSPGLDLGSGVYWAMAARAMLRLKPRAVRNSTINPDTYKQECHYDRGLTYKMLVLLADRLSEALKLFVVSYVSILDRQAKNEEALRLALQGFATAEEEREAQIEDARERARALKPKRRTDANANPLDHIPAHFSPEERRAFINLHMTAATRQRQEVSAP